MANAYNNLRWRGCFQLEGVNPYIQNFNVHEVFSENNEIPNIIPGVCINGEFGNPTLILLKSYSHTFTLENVNYFNIKTTTGQLVFSLTKQEKTKTFTVPNSLPSFLYYESEGNTGEIITVFQNDFIVYRKGDSVRASNGSAYIATRTSFGADPAHAESGFIPMTLPVHLSGGTF
jgi:hypothetical protein